MFRKVLDNTLKALDPRLMLLKSDIESKKENEPCTTSLMLLEQSALSGFLFKEPVDCKEVLRLHKKNLSDQSLSRESQFKELISQYPKITRCFYNAAAHTGLMKFGSIEVEQYTASAGQAISSLNNVMLQVAGQQTPYKAAQITLEYSDGQAMAEILSQFRMFHYQCRTTPKNPQDVSNVKLYFDMKIS